MPVLGLRPLVAAIAFLTRVPVRRAGGPAPPLDMVAAAPLFPLVGAAIGVAVGATAVLLTPMLSPLLAASLAVALELALTGALHVDALADSADGLGGHDREHSLAIMRDHSLGAYGAAALTLDLLAKTAALATLAEHDLVLPVIAAYAISRAAPLPLAASLPYARTEDGTGRTLADCLRKRWAFAGVLLAAVIAIAATGPQAGATLACLLLTTTVVGALARRRTGGVTGDTMGAATELTATLALIVAAGLAP
ncbi:MAG TPA: adenosylcobinamide-GDP ribazoletransferase [Thermoleophilaceae bacterium]|nr:adenosylcobinamide-GDP ribazoletransferase [Thermoleophilaceae bacterium]